MWNRGLSGMFDNQEGRVSSEYLLCEVYVKILWRTFYWMWKSKYSIFYKRWATINQTNYKKKPLSKIASPVCTLFIAIRLYQQHMVSIFLLGVQRGPLKFDPRALDLFSNWQQWEVKFLFHCCCSSVILKLLHPLYFTISTKKTQQQKSYLAVVLAEGWTEAGVVVVVNKIIIGELKPCDWVEDCFGAGVASRQPGPRCLAEHPLPTSGTSCNTSLSKLLSIRICIYTLVTHAALIKKAEQSWHGVPCGTAKVNRSWEAVSRVTVCCACTTGSLIKTERKNLSSASALYHFT